MGAHIRAAVALAVNIFIFHLAGRRSVSPTVDGLRGRPLRSLQLAFVSPVIAMVLSSAILFYGMRFAPVVGSEVRIDGVGTEGTIGAGKT